MPETTALHTSINTANYGTNFGVEIIETVREKVIDLEFIPNATHPTNELSGERWDKAIALLGSIRRHADNNPLSPWFLYCVGEDDRDFVDIVDLWACGLARIRKLIDAAGGQKNVYLALSA